MQRQEQSIWKNKGQLKKKQKQPVMGNLYTDIHFLLRFSVLYLTAIARQMSLLDGIFSAFKLGLNRTEVRSDYFELTKTSLIPDTMNLFYLGSRQKFSVLFLTVEEIFIPEYDLNKQES